MGWLARSHGLQANSVTAIELVTAEGEFVRTDADNDPELFWALRGGGGNFGIVTALEFRLYPLTRDLRRLHALGLDRGRARADGLGAVGRRRPRPRHDLLPDHADARRCEEIPELDPRPLAGDDRRRRPGRPGRARRRCARSAPRSTRSRWSPRPRSCACTRTPRSRCRTSAGTALVDAAARRRRSPRCSRTPARAPARRWRASSCARSAARCAAPRARPRRGRGHRRRSSSCSPRGMALDADMGAFMLAHAGRVKAALAPWLRRRPVPQLRRGRRRHRADLRRRHRTPACARSRTASTRDNAIHANHAI